MKKQNTIFFICFLTGLILLSLIFKNNVSRLKQESDETIVKEQPIIKKPESPPAVKTTREQNKKINRIRQRLQRKGIKPHDALYWEESN